MRHPAGTKLLCIKLVPRMHGMEACVPPEIWTVCEMQSDIAGCYVRNGDKRRPIVWDRIGEYFEVLP